MGGVRDADRAISDEPASFSKPLGDPVTSVRDGLALGRLVGGVTSCPALGDAIPKERTSSSNPGRALEILDLVWREVLEGSVGGLE